MNKILLSIYILAHVALAQNVWGQAPQTFNYQSLIRDAAGKLIRGKPIGIRFSILQDSITGTPIYTETQNVTTNTNGLINALVGDGMAILGNISDIDWSSGSFFLQTATDPSGGTTYTNTTGSQILSVPYALYALKNRPPASSNGDTTVAYNIELGGALTRTTEIGTSKSNTLAITGLLSAESTDHILTTNPITDIVSKKPIQEIAWSIQGNVITDRDHAFLGTMGYPRLIFRVNNVVSAQLGNQSTDYITSFGYSTDYFGTNSLLGYKTHGALSSSTPNTSIGYLATGNGGSYGDNVSAGNEALDGCSSPENQSTAAGSKTLLLNKNGNANTAVGKEALSYNDTGMYNVAAGINAGNSRLNANNTIAIGSNSGGTFPVVNKTEIGNTYMDWIGGQVSWSTYSDARIKKDIRENVAGLAFITKLQPASYYIDAHRQYQLISEKPDTTYWTEKYNIEHIRQTGFIAQDVAAAARSAGYDFSGVDIPKNESELYTLRYTDFVVPLVKAVQEQQTLIERLMKQSEEIEKRVLTLKEK